MTFGQGSDTFASISYSALQIRFPRAHVPPRFRDKVAGLELGTEFPPANPAVGISCRIEALARRQACR
jgi:hypothetical protein